MSRARTPADRASLLLPPAVWSVLRAALIADRFDRPGGVSLAEIPPPRLEDLPGTRRAKAHAMVEYATRVRALLTDRGWGYLLAEEDARDPAGIFADCPTWCDQHHHPVEIDELWHTSQVWEAPGIEAQLIQAQHPDPAGSAPRLRVWLDTEWVDLDTDQAEQLAAAITAALPALHASEQAHDRALDDQLATLLEQHGSQ